MPTKQKSFTKAQQHSIDMLCASIRLIEELVPLEQQRFSKQRKRKLESAHVTLRHHAYTFDLSLPMLSALYQPEQYLEHAHLVADRLSEQFASTWRRCEKLTPTRARPTTQADYDARRGLIETCEGPAPFTVSDYLAEDALGEYPIGRTIIEKRYVQIAPADNLGWASYRSTEIREACQQFRTFDTDCGVTGFAGDYLLRGQEGKTWPCAKAKFEREYHFLDFAVRETVSQGKSTRRELEDAR